MSKNPKYGSSLFLVASHAPRPVFTTHPQSGLKTAKHGKDYLFKDDFRQFFSMNELIEEELTKKIIGAAIEVYRYWVRAWWSVYV
jgi:hypothetical protein